MTSFLAALDHFLDALQRDRGLSPATLQHYRKDLLLFAQWATLKQLTVSQIETATVLAFLADMLQNGHSAADSSRMLARLRKFYAYLDKAGWVHADPTKDIP